MDSAWWPLFFGLLAALIFLRLCGFGAQSRVAERQARHLVEQQPTALKLIRPDEAADEPIYVATAIPNPDLPERGGLVR